MFKTYCDQIGERFKTQAGAVWLLCFLTFSRCLAYYWESNTMLSHLFERMEADWVSPSLWGLSFLLLVVAALSRNQQALILSMGVTMAVVFLWGLLYLWSDPIAFLSRGSVYLTLCGFAVWGTVRPVKTPKEGGDAVGRPANN